MYEFGNVWISGVARPSPKVEGQRHDHHRNHRQHQPRIRRQSFFDVIVQKHAPSWSSVRGRRGRGTTVPSRRDHARYRGVAAGDRVAHEGRHQVPADDHAPAPPHPSRAAWANSSLAQGQDLRAHGAQAGQSARPGIPMVMPKNPTGVPGHRQGRRAATSHSRIIGKLRMISIRRWMMLSTQPP